ncbi:MAG: hypothetical protein ACTH2N_06425 [Brachybacterium tyrofermentans]|uniref:hypothetical protein n=1 Tax=Brachybacterium tyrofermentans TaxID=47848 RepID=UPI003FB72037
MAKKNSLDDMRDEAYRRQDNLASDIDELVDRVNPKNAATRWKNELVGSVKGFSDAGDDKSASTLPIAIAGGVIGVVLIGAGIAAAIALSGGDDKPAKPSNTAKAATKNVKKTSKKASEQASAQTQKAKASAAKARAELDKALATAKARAAGD